VLIAGAPAARKGDLATCPDGAGAVTRGNPMVLIAGQAAARQTDSTAHGGKITGGCPRVLIGNPLLDADGNRFSIPPECAYLTKGGTVEAPERYFTQHRTAATVGPGTPTTHKFPGDTSPRPAISYPVEVRGKKITVIAPADATGKGLPSVQQVANGLGGISDEQLAETDRVVLSPNRNPEDAEWERAYGIPGFRSAAVAGDHEITFFPNSDGGNANVDATVIHEAGHLYGQKLWKDPANEAAWKAAMAADGRSVSTYADASEAEDFAESCVMYALSLGTPCEATARKLFPNRYKELDRLFPHGFPRQGARP
jgi:hypothetical protein